MPLNLITLLTIFMATPSVFAIINPGTPVSDTAPQSPTPRPYQLTSRVEYCRHSYSPTSNKEENFKLCKLIYVRSGSNLEVSSTFTILFEDQTIKEIIVNNMVFDQSSSNEEYLVLRYELIGQTSIAGRLENSVSYLYVYFDKKVFPQNYTQPKYIRGTLPDSQIIEMCGVENCIPPPPLTVKFP